MDAGVICTVSTDDPISFGSTLADEYHLLADSLGFSKHDLARVARAGFKIALACGSWKGTPLEEIEGVTSLAKK
jgi:adenosine deaminase